MWVLKLEFPLANLSPNRMNLERPASLSNPYPYWPPRDATPEVHNPIINRNSNIQHANPLTSIADIPLQPHPRTIETMQVNAG